MSKKTIDEIVEEKMPTFANEIKSMRSKEELEGSLIIYLKEKEGLMIQKARDEELVQLKERKAKLSKPYNQTISALKNMMECVYKFGRSFENDLKEEFEKNLVAYARQLSEVKRQKDQDTELNAINDMIKEINEDYDPTIKSLEMRCEYVSFVLKERFDLDAPKVEI